jgi:nitrogen fixation protein NifU and related proteins
VDLYAEHILDHYRSPRGKNPLDDASVTHTERNLSCGDALTLSLKIEDGVIQGLGWDGTGCAISQAGMSLLSEELAGQAVDQAKHTDAHHMLTLLGVPIGPRRMKCALLGLHTLKNTLHQHAGEPHQPWRDTAEEA